MQSTSEPKGGTSTPTGAKHDVTVTEKTGGNGGHHRLNNFPMGGKPGYKA